MLFGGRHKPKREINIAPVEASPEGQSDAAEARREINMAPAEASSEGQNDRAQALRDSNIALLEASYKGQSARVQALLKGGADPNTCLTDVPSRRGWASSSKLSPLFLAAYGGHADVVGLLLAAGADPNWQSSNGETVLHRAAKSEGSTGAAAVKRLLAAGADPNIQSKEGSTPLRAATNTNNKEIISLLEAAGAKPPGNTIDSICSCGERISAVPDWPFTCPACGILQPWWQPPAFYIRRWTEEGRFGRDDDSSRRYAAKLLARPEPAQAAALHLAGILSQWEVAHRSVSSTGIMRACEQRIMDTKRRLMQAGGNALWYEACMALSPDLRHVASKDFGTDGEYHGAYNPGDDEGNGLLS